MKYIITLLFFIPALALANPPDGYPFLGYDQGLAKAKAENKPIFLYFGRFGCPWCAHTNKETFSDPGLKQRYVSHYVLVYVDAEGYKRLTLPSGETITEAELGARLNVFATPLFVYLTPQGKVIFKAPGFKTVQDFIDFDHYVTDGHYKTETLLQFLDKKK
jgi:thioredoxin-related protein